MGSRVFAIAPGTLRALPSTNHLGIESRSLSKGKGAASEEVTLVRGGLEKKVLEVGETPQGMTGATMSLFQGTHQALNQPNLFKSEFKSEIKSKLGFSIDSIVGHTTSKSPTSSPPSPPSHQDHVADHLYANPQCLHRDKSLPPPRPPR